MSTKKQIIVVELNHKSAPIEIRESISQNAAELEEAFNRLKSEIPEIFILSTCNRIAVYAFCESTLPILKVFRTFCNQLTKKHLTILYNEKAVSHIFSTASGLESQIIGEHEILGQIRNAYQSSTERKITGPILNELIKRAIHVGKRVRTETFIGQHAISLAAVSSGIIKRTFKDLSGKSVMVFGTGEMAQIMLKMLKKTNVEKIFIISSDPERADRLAKMYRASAVGYQESDHLSHSMHVLIGATKTKDFVIKKSKFRGNNQCRVQILIDLGMPRNFDPELGKLISADLYDLEDLKHVASQGLDKRKKEVVLARNIITDEKGKYMNWLDFRQYVPLIKNLKNKLQQAERHCLHSLFSKNPNLSPQQKIAIELASNSAVRKKISRTISSFKANNPALSHMAG